ncbi:uncharacterized protein LY89DRAFT_681135 [Mollisia scopiformis]|uniref:Uncharacterized protein n=1 Tax=Mollisia scopiformis TaxID=149040 RepID=A0A194XNI4_MOLSC|nr:uncharacterized protein LY89DRAFT_681135 [Mollisia scopiformis]KUJ21711.1 hypothetical protein LY89DRAFT_681135 [Mollisia scopiformis]
MAGHEITRYFICAIRARLNSRQTPVSDGRGLESTSPDFPRPTSPSPIQGVAPGPEKSGDDTHACLTYSITTYSG